MLRSERGFTVVQFIIAMTIAGLLMVGVFIAVAQRSWRDDQRRKDLGVVSAMIERYAANSLGKYPLTKAATTEGSQLRVQFEALRLTDPKADKYYVLGSKFDDCNPSASSAEGGPGYISYSRPGQNGPFKLRMCLEWGEFYIGD